MLCNDIYVIGVWGNETHLLLMTSKFLVFGFTSQGLQLNAERVQEIARVDDHSAVALEAHPVRQS